MGMVSLKLRDAIGLINNLFFISDQYISIQMGINAVFPNAAHEFCTYYISKKLKAKYKIR